MKKTLIILALIATTAIAYCQPSAWPYPAITPSATDTLLIWHNDSTKVITWQDVLDASGETFDTTYLYSKLLLMSDSTATNADSINIAMDSLRIHIARILALEALPAGSAADSSFVAVDFVQAASVTAVEGRVYYDSDDNFLKVYDGTAWDTLNIPGAGGGGTGDMMYTDTTAMLSPYPDFTEMRGEISDSLDALLLAGEPGVALADSAGVDVGSYVTGYDYVTGIALKANSTDVALNTDVDLFFAYGGGFSLPGDTALWIMDADKEIGYRKQIEDTLIITLIERDLSAGDTLNYSVVYGDTLEDADVMILTVTAGGGRVATTSFTNAKVPEGNYVWINIGEQIAGKKPIYFRSEIYGYIKRD